VFSNSLNLCSSPNVREQVNLSMVLRPFVGPWPLFSFQILYTVSGAGIAQSVLRLATGWTPRGSRNSSPDRVTNFHFSISSRPNLGSTQPPIKWVPGALSRG
jgi:hypothetical protein